MGMNERQLRYMLAMTTNLAPHQYWAALMQTGSRVIGSESVYECVDRRRAASRYLGALFDATERIADDDGRIAIVSAASTAREDIGITHEAMIENYIGPGDPDVQGMQAVLDTLAEVVHDLEYVQARGR